MSHSKLTARRIGYAVSITLVAAIAAWSSYKHLLDVARIAGQPIEVAATLPLSVDGMLVVASLAMSEDKANGRRPRSWARIAFWLGATISVAANIASIVVHRGGDPLGIGVAAWAPIALLVVTEIMARPGRPSKDAVRSEAALKGVQTRRANAAKRTRKPRTRKATQVAELEQAYSLPSAPVSPGTVTDRT